MKKTRGRKSRVRVPLKKSVFLCVALHKLWGKGRTGASSFPVPEPRTLHFAILAVICYNEIEDMLYCVRIIGKVMFLSKSGTVPRRVMNLNNMTAFRDNLKNMQWDDVTSTDNVDDCYELFWNKFKTLYDVHFPVVKTRFNRNYHRVAEFMTQGLIVSRRRKIELLKISINNPTVDNCSKYKVYRNMYNKLVRARKKLHYHEKIEKSQKNPKKMWEILKEFTSGPKPKETIDKIITPEGETYDKSKMANTFNRFFCEIGTKISESVDRTSAMPEDYITERARCSTYGIWCLLTGRIY
jgi:hypothetical protein